MRAQPPVCSVACLEWRAGDTASPMPLKGTLQKRLGGRLGLLRKTPRLFADRKAIRGLKCGLSGNPVRRLATTPKKVVKGNRLVGDDRDTFLGNPTGPKPQDLPG
jgi:hypothetical protein